MKVRDHATLETLRRLEKKEKDAWQAKRLRIIILAAQGFTAPSIAMILDLSRRDVQLWVERYNREGLHGLDDQRGGNRRNSLGNVRQKEDRDSLLLRAGYWYDRAHAKLTSGLERLKVEKRLEELAEVRQRRAADIHRLHPDKDAPQDLWNGLY